MGAKRIGEGRGPSQRQLKAGEVIRRALADILMRGDVHDAALSRASITVSEVRCSPDLRQATVYVMPLAGAALPETLTALARSKGELRHELSKLVSLKFLPDLRFVADDSYDRMDETRRLLSEERVRRDVERKADEDEDDADGDGAGGG